MNTTPDIMSKLRSLSNILDSEYSYINQGGCCVVAGYLALFLRHHVPTRVVVLEYSKTDLEEVRNNTNNSRSMADWHRNGCNFCHVLVEFDYEGEVWHVDAAGIWLKESNRYHLRQAAGTLSIEEAIAFGRQSDWNPAFDREQIPDIKREITRAFNGYGQRAAA